MKFRIEPWPTKFAQLSRWHRVFAIWPKRVDDSTYVFLSFIERQMFGSVTDPLFLIKHGQRYEWRYRRAGSDEQGWPRPSEKMPRPPRPKDEESMIP